MCLLHVQAVSRPSVEQDYTYRNVRISGSGSGLVFGHLKALLKPGGILFGATVLHHGVTHNPAAKLLMARLNARQIFSNRDDTLLDLTQTLDQHLDDVQIESLGSVALFSGRA